VLLRKWYQIHSDFIHVNIKVSLESHRASHVINYICNDSIFFLKVILLLLFIASLHDGCPLFNLVLHGFISSKCAFGLFYFVILLVYP
jgi:hypothetical protein